MMVTLPAGNRRRRDPINGNLHTITILVASVDRLMAEEALDECRLANHIDFVEDGARFPSLGRPGENRA
jgi:hypothetical protein